MSCISRIFKDGVVFWGTLLVVVERDWTESANESRVSLMNIFHACVGFVFIRLPFGYVKWECTDWVGWNDLCQSSIIDLCILEQLVLFH